MWHNRNKLRCIPSKWIRKNCNLNRQTKQNKQPTSERRFRVVNVIFPNEHKQDNYNSNKSLTWTSRKTFCVANLFVFIFAPLNAAFAVIYHHTKWNGWWDTKKRDREHEKHWIFMAFRKSQNALHSFSTNVYQSFVKLSHKNECVPIFLAFERIFNMRTRACSVTKKESWWE